MYFIEFPVSTTNIFPLANSEAGGQLLSEYNLRSRESVATDPSVKYPIGPSYVHSEDDFKVYIASDGVDIPSTAIQISPGRAVVNGHYVESLAPIVIDLAAVNFKANQEHVNQLKGDLAVGLVMMYSTYQTLAASALAENDEGYYDGIRVVIVPEADAKRPIDVPEENQYDQVNMHLRLGTFTFYNGQVSNVHQDADKLKVYDASRIGDIGATLDSRYVTREGLDPNRLYVFSSKSSDGIHVDGGDTWCSADESLMKWDIPAPIQTNVEPPSYIAHFEYDTTSGKTELVVPHKQVDGAIDQYGRPVYFADKRYQIPNATFSKTSGGVVNPYYTSRVLHIEEMVNQFYRLPNGKMRKYINILTTPPTEKTGDEDGLLPDIPVADGSIQPLDISSIISNLVTILTSVKTQLVGTSSNISAGGDSVASQILSVIDSLASGNPSVVSKLGAINSNLDTASTTLNGVIDTGAAIDTIVGTLNSAISDIDNNHSADAKTKLETSAIPSLNGLKSNQLTSVWSKINESINSIGTIISQDIGGQSGVAHNLQAIIGNISTPNTLVYCKTMLDEAISTIEGIETTIENYIEEEVNRRWDEVSTLTTTVWSPGDYVVVASDQTQAQMIDGSYPSTMYVVNYGQIETIDYVDSLSITILATDTESASKLDLFRHKVPHDLAGGVELYSAEASAAPPPSTDWAKLNYTQFYGAVRKDYFVLSYVTENIESDVVVSRTYTNYFYTPTSTKVELTYITPPIRISGGISFATEETIGGFLNVKETDYGNGYVMRDSDGRLRIVDYNLLMLGLQAQQLGEDYDAGSGMDLVAIQESLDNYVNDRICYPNADQIKNAEADGRDPHVIHLVLHLPATTETSTLRIHDIGSRANSSLYVHIKGSATSATTVLFENCDKLRIDETIEGNPNIALKNVNLYYSSTVLDAVGPHDEVSTTTGAANLTLWYEQDNDSLSANLQVDGMTVTLVEPVVATESIEPWNQEYAPNDNHYSYALRSVTFANDASIIGASLLVSDDSTMNIDMGTYLFRSNFSLPQSSGLAYPTSKLTHRIKVTGSFDTCYWLASEGKYVLKNTDFSAMTSTVTSETSGSIAFCTTASLISHVTGVAESENIDCWGLNSKNIFYGGAID